MVISVASSALLTQASCPKYWNDWSANMKSFGKRSYCPTSHEILAHVEGSLSPLTRQRVEEHALHCDFCGAELQLLAKCAPIEEDYTPAPTPALIKVLGINLRAPEVSMVQRAHAA